MQGYGRPDRLSQGPGDLRSTAGKSNDAKPSPDRRRRGIVPGPCGLLLILVSLLPLGAADLRIGTASVVITPPAGMPMAGSYSLRVSEGVLDDLHTKALVLEKDGVRAALVACDLIAVSDEVVSEARQLIEQNTGIPGKSRHDQRHAHPFGAFHAGPRELRQILWRRDGSLSAVSADTARPDR